MILIVSAGARRVRARLVVLLLIILALAAAPRAGLARDLENVEARVEALLARMTLEEKVGQLNLMSHGPGFDIEAVRRGRVGALINFNNAQDIAAAQQAARETRLGVPLLFGLDVLHGFRTAFPVPLAETATFNPALSRFASEWVAREAAYIGVQWTYAPMVDVARDPRWGRIVEGSGEDPYLGRVFAAARVEGFRNGGLAAAPKHFAGYGAVEGGRDYDLTNIPQPELRDVYLPPFRAALKAGALSLMSAFNALNGTPATANRWLLTDVLRKEWGFDGFVVSDWSAIEELMGHGVALNEAEAARKAIDAGVDMDLMAGIYDRNLANEVRAGRVSPATLDDAVRRVLRTKFRLGLFEREPADPARVDAIFPSPESRRAALTVARETLVLLQNRHETLPLGRGVRSLAVVGGLADSRWDLLGPHAARGHAEDTPTLIERIRQRADKAGVSVAYAAGCDGECLAADGFGAAVEAARAADAVVAVLGEPRDISGEAASRAHLTLPGRQADLLEALAATGKPVIVVLVAGRPLELVRFADRVPAILMAWYPGTEGAAAIAEALFGDVNPSGKLPMTWPRTTGQLPLYYNRLPSGRPHEPGQRFTLNYLDEGLEPLFPFGWGLSYTTFKFSDLTVETPRVRADDAVEIRVTVTNTGVRAGQEVAQLYARDPVASRSRPVRELKGFEKIALDPGASKAVTFRVPAREFGFHLDDGSYVVEPGAFHVWVGASSLTEYGGRFEVTDGLRLPPGAGP